ncbi:MAG: Flp pilus assembly complex ATPase component TadA [Candidatus Competibacteraceae bacterium]|nr:Flp pilus assembly complex ATPase component TadA [Candidatus Competibacteraceae bacterium]
MSDITLQSGHPIFIERFGRLGPITRRRLPAPELYHLAQIIYGDNAPSQLAAGQDIDCSYEIKLGRQDLRRFRVNMTAIRAGRERGLEITLRTIPTTPPTLDSLALPDDLRQSLVFEQGLVLITGPTGSGKTTLLAAIIRNLLEQPESHRKILTYEAPIEYVYDAIPRAHALIAQHEIGVHLPSFAAGVRNSLRRKPMVILVGEARDAATIAAAAEAAMTGHLVYTTVHANSVPETLRRMVSVFPAEERDGRLMDITEALQTIVTQRLVRTTDGQRAAIREYLRFTASMKDEILARPAAQVVSATRKAVLDFGRPLTVDLDALKAAGRIDEREYALFRGLGTQLE